VIRFFLNPVEEGKWHKLKAEIASSLTVVFTAGNALATRGSSPTYPETCAKSYAKQEWIKWQKL
jgi:hypothetical protein